MQQVTYAAGDAEKSIAAYLKANGSPIQTFMWGRCRLLLVLKTLPLCGNGVLGDGEVCDGDVGDTARVLKVFRWTSPVKTVDYDTTGC